MLDERGMSRFRRITDGPRLRVVPGSGVLPHPPRPRSLPPRTLAVAAAREGLGATSLGVNLSLALRELGQRVLVVGRDRKLETMDDVDFLYAGPDTADAPAAELDADERRRLLGSLIRVTKDFDFIVLDLPAGIDCLPYAIRAELVLLVSTEDSCPDTHALVRRLAAFGCPNPRVVVNRAHSQADAEQVYMRVCSAPNRRGDTSLEYWGYVPEDGAVPQAERWRKPFLVTAPDAPSSRHVRRLAWRVLGGQTPRGGIHASLPLFHYDDGGKDRGHAA